MFHWCNAIRHTRKQIWHDWRDIGLVYWTNLSRLVHRTTIRPQNWDIVRISMPFNREYRGETRRDDISFKYWMAKTMIFFLVLHRYLLVNSNFLSALPDAFNFSPEKIFSQFPSNLIWRGSRLSSRACRSMSACSWATWRKSPYLELCQTDFWESNAMLSSSKWWWILAWEGNFIKQDQYLSVEPSM